MTTHYYSPHTGEHIETATPADWMGRTDQKPPAYNRQTQSAFFRDGAWGVEDAQPPAIPVPQQVTRAQGKVVLIQMGLWQQVVAFVDAIEDPLQKAIAEVAVYETLHWQRDSPFLNQAAEALGITQEQMDRLFIQASEVML